MKTTRIDWIDRMNAVCFPVVMLVHLEAGQGYPGVCPGFWERKGGTDNEKTQRDGDPYLPLQCPVHHVQPVSRAIQTGGGTAGGNHPQAAPDVFYQHHRR